MWDLVARLLPVVHDIALHLGRMRETEVLLPEAIGDARRAGYRACPRHRVSGKNSCAPIVDAFTERNNNVGTAGGASASDADWVGGNRWFYGCCQDFLEVLFFFPLTTLQEAREIEIRSMRRWHPVRGFVSVQ